MEKDIDLQKPNDTIKAITDSLHNFAGTLTGKNLEEKLVEYSEVYGEILLYLYQEQEHQKKDIKFLRKELHRLEEMIHKSLQGNQSENYRKSKLHVISIYLLLLINAILLIIIIKLL